MVQKLGSGMGTYNYSANGIAITGSGQNYPGTGDIYLTGITDYASSYAPQNFWIASGDSVGVRFYDNNNSGAYYGFHFTTITEA
jgi:hypothetical protein